MAKKEIFIDTHIGVVYSPLSSTQTIIVEGSVGDSQQFDRSTGMYVPNYTATFCVLRPILEISDPDGVLPDGPVQMTNMHWYELDGETETELSNGTDYQMDSEGRLSVRKNVDPGKTRTFRFRGEYLDDRTGERLRMVMDHALTCEAVLEQPKLFLNQPQMQEWDPTADTDAERAAHSKVIVEAVLRIGATEVPAAQREFVWEKKDESDSDFAPIDGTDILDYDVEVSADGTKLTVYREWMGERIDIRCRAKYDPYGNPSSVTLDERSPSATVVFTRNVPTPDVKPLTAQRLKPTLKTFMPQAKVFVGVREVTDPLRFWSINWYMSKGNAAGTVSRTKVAEGLNPTISTADIAKVYGATLTPGVKEKDPARGLLVKDSSGNDRLLCIDGTSPLLI